MSTLFPATYSTLSAPALAEFISRRYDLKEVSCRLLVRGVGDTYLAETRDNRYIFRVYRSSHRHLGHIKAETELLSVLHRKSVPVSYPIPDLSGEVIQAFDAIEGARYGVLFSYARGKVVPVLSEPQLHSLGIAMAQFHDVSSAIRLQERRWDYDPQTTLSEPLERIAPYFVSLPEEYAWWQEAAGVAVTKLKALPTENFPSGYCHYDFLPKNFHFEGDNITFFDFDFFGYGWLINDLMTFWVHLSLDVHFGRLAREAADKAFTGFLEAYRSVRPVSEAELAAMPYLSLGFWLYFCAFHTTHDQFYELTQPAHLKMRTRLIRQLQDRYWER